MVKASELIIEVEAEHRPYGVRCCYCDTKWPCQSIRLALENRELQSQIVILKAQYNKLKFGVA